MPTQPPHTKPPHAMLHAEAVTRRRFLALCGAGALAGALPGCGEALTRPRVATPIPSPTIKPTPAAADWTALGDGLRGTLVRPGDAHYATAYQLFDPRFDGVRPAAVAYCETPDDVVACLAFARRFVVPLAIRAGGHSFAGYSTTTGLILDISRMNAISVDAANGNATVGAGARLIDVYAALAPFGLALPAGSCPTVGIAGLTLGGGVGVLGRKLGLTCDSLLAARVVAADGRSLACDADHEPDLFWALRGGGGGNFAVATEFTFHVSPVATLTLATLNWPWSSAAAVVDAWQRWAPQAPDALWSNCLLLSSDDTGAEPVVRVNGVYAGGAAPLDALLGQLIGQIGQAPASRFEGSDSMLDAMLVDAGCAGLTVPECHLPTQDPHGQVPRVTAGARSDYFTTLMPRAGVAALVRAIAQRQAGSLLGGGGIGIDAYGGAINRVAADATAFVHRDALFSAQYSANWSVSDPAARIAANKAWLTATWEAMRPYASGGAYQNYIDPDLSDWPTAYYGANLPRLQRVKAAYDPINLFHFAQSIPLATGG